MTWPIFIDLTDDLRGAINIVPTGGFFASTYHKPTEKVTYAVVPEMEDVWSYFDAARLRFAEPEGRA